MFCKGGYMKNKSLFKQILLLVIIAFVCVTLTLLIALLVGSIDTPIFDFRNLNIANMIPIFIFGGIITCFAIAIAFLFTSKTLFDKIKIFFEDTKNNNEK